MNELLRTDDIETLPEDFELTAADVNRHLAVIEDRRQRLTAMLNDGVSPEHYGKLVGVRDALVLAEQLLQRVDTLLAR